MVRLSECFFDFYLFMISGLPFFIFELMMMLNVEMLLRLLILKMKLALKSIIVYHILDIYDQATWEDPDHKNDPVKVVQMIEIYCNPRKNEVLESHSFWSMPVQEPFDNFLTE